MRFINKTYANYIERLSIKLYTGHTLKFCTSISVYYYRLISIDKDVLTYEHIYLNSISTRTTHKTNFFPDYLPEIISLEEYDAVRKQAQIL